MTLLRFLGSTAEFAVLPGTSGFGFRLGAAALSTESDSMGVLGHSAAPSEATGHARRQDFRRRHHLFKHRLVDVVAQLRDAAAAIVHHVCEVSGIGLTAPRHGVRGVSRERRPHDALDFHAVVAAAGQHVDARQPVCRAVVAERVSIGERRLGAVRVRHVEILT